MAVFRNVMVYLGLGPDDEYDENYLYTEGNVDFDGLERRTQTGGRGNDGVRVFDDEDDLGVGAVRPLRPVPDGFESSSGDFFGETGASAQGYASDVDRGQSAPAPMQHPSAGFDGSEIAPVKPGSDGKPDLFESRSFGLESEASGFDPQQPLESATEASPLGQRAGGAFASGPDSHTSGLAGSAGSARSSTASTQQRVSSQPQNDRSSYGMDEFSQPQSSSGVKPRTVVPRSFDDAKNVANDYRNGSPVVMNLRETDKETGRRLLDFSSGMVYGLGGGMEKLASNVFLITPDGASVSAEDRRRLEERGYGR